MTTKRQLVDRIEEIGEEMESHRRAVLALDEERLMLVEMLSEWKGEAWDETSPEPKSDPPDTEPGTPRTKSSQRMKATIVPKCTNCGADLDAGSETLTCPRCW